jgi:uroporphyrinogen decarboxylase
MEQNSPDFNRLVATLQHTEPDRVPLAEVAIDYAIMSQFLGRPVTDEDVASQVEFWTRAGYDYSLFTVGMMRPGGVTKDSQISKVMSHTLAREDTDDEAWNLWKKPRIFNESDFETFPWEQASQLDYSKFEAAQNLPDKMKIIAASGKIFTMSWMAMGFENFCVNLKLNPEFTTKVIEQIAKIQLDGVRRVVNYPNIGAVWAVDDLAFGSGSMLRLKDYRKFIFPWYEELASICHSHGLFLFFHTDGVIWDLAEDLIAVGVDAIHPIDPTCMDIDEVKSRLGKRVSLVGNISNELLSTGTPDQVAELTRQRLRTIAPGGGYCLGSGNSVPAWAKIENYRAMLDTVLRHGHYPIDL